MRKIYLLFFMALFVSCKNRTVEILEMQLKSDRYFYSDDYRPFKGICRIYYFNTEVIKMTSSYSNGILNGQTVLFYEDGTPHRKGNYAKGKCHGLWEGWFKNGEKEFEVNYKNGKLNGGYIAYHRNGTIKEKGEYKDNIRINEWISFSESGNELSRIIY